MMMMLSNCKERLIVMYVTGWLFFYSIVQGLFYFFIFINLLKLNLQHLQRFKFDKMIVNVTILLMIYILSMYIALEVFTVVKKNCLGWNVNVLGLKLKYSIFNVIICLIMFIVYKLLSFFDILIVDGAIIVLDDILLKKAFLNHLLVCFMIFAVFLNDTTETITQTTARTTKVHIISLWAGYNINTFATSCACNCNVNCWKKKTTERESKETSKRKHQSKRSNIEYKE